MARSIRKAREHAWIEEVQTSGALPPGEIVDCETPDALLKSGDITIGIEVTDDIRGQSTDAGGSKMRAVETAATQFARSVRDVFERQHGIPLWVTFTWHSRLLPRDQTSRTTLAEDLAALVAGFAPAQIGRRVRIPDEALEGTGLSRYLHAPWIMRVKKQEHATDIARSGVPRVLTSADRDVAVISPAASRPPRAGRGKRASREDALWDIVGIADAADFPDVPDDVSTNKHRYLADAYDANR